MAALQTSGLLQPVSGCCLSGQTPWNSKDKVVALRPSSHGGLPRRAGKCIASLSVRKGSWQAAVDGKNDSPLSCRQALSGWSTRETVSGGARLLDRTDRFGVCRATDGEDNGRGGPSSNSNSALEDPPAKFYETSTPGDDDDEQSPIQKWLYPSKDELPDDVEMSIWDHLEELRERILVSVGFVGAAITLCFCFSKELVTFLEAPVYQQGVRFLQLSPGEFFFTTLKVSGYCGLLLGSPVILYEIIAFVLPGLTLNERRFLGPIVLGSSVLFYAGLAFSYSVLTPAALNFFISYAEGVVESIWSIDQYFEFVLVLMLSTGLSFQVPVIQLLLGSTGIVSSQQMLAVWKYVVVGAVVAAAVLTPSTDPLTQLLLAGPLIGLYMGGAFAVKLVEGGRETA